MTEDQAQLIIYLLFAILGIGITATFRLNQLVKEINRRSLDRQS